MISSKTDKEKRAPTKASEKGAKKEDFWSSPHEMGANSPHEMGGTSGGLKMSTPLGGGGPSSLDTPDIINFIR